ncbi:type II toxin-antitoxin system Phd/YefM family antitoxin [Oryzicola mucosus]|uniref:Antitoxin n=1 Tax=Oryzicola mucosus TaxID=2767425 RepID=A0A8J6PMI6_9HYPH|nr:type II toxin-antitoxin system Phd/YefM family antitoxin [Oryzicola mucosus]MBD0413985.1 type II toxin-antitoxin system Phd/YefM family antitoxin [Oryzicola mucosus]
MRTVGALEARKTPGSLLELIEMGEDIVITRHGKPMARLVALVEEIDRKARARAAGKRLLERAKGQSLGGISIKELIEDGRR